MIPKDLVEAVQNSDVARIDAMRGAIGSHDDPWEIHLSLFPRRGTARRRRYSRSLDGRPVS